jgi:hypothetical protein
MSNEPVGRLGGRATIGRLGSPTRQTFLSRSVTLFIAILLCTFLVLDVVGDAVAQDLG